MTGRPIPVDAQLLGLLVPATESGVIQDSQLVDAVAAAVALLPARELEAIQQMGLASQSTRAAAAEIGTSRSTAHRSYKSALQKLAGLLVAEPAVMRRHQDLHLTWEAGASAAAHEIELEATATQRTQTVDQALEWLTVARDHMADAWVRGTATLDADAMFIDLGAVALGQIGTPVRSIVATVIDKQKSYGAGNILAFGNTGLAVRISDKVERLKNLTRSGHTPTHSEPLSDTWLDLVGYSIVGLMLANNTFTNPLAQETDHG